eukprot:gene7706-8543_t
MPVVVGSLPGQVSSPGASISAAAEELDAQLQNDRQLVELGSQLGISGNGFVTFSGINDYDYPNIFGLPQHQHADLSGTLLSTVKRVPIPEELFEQFDRILPPAYALAFLLMLDVQANVTIGLFAEINRAWLAIDSDIYVWNFEDGSDVAYFDGLDEVILAAGLITPKPGVFQDHIKFLLCITTPFNVVVLGVGFAEENDGKVYKEMHLQPQPLFTVATDSVFMTSVTGTWNGRIFLSGADGCLYEIAYQAQNSWFRQRCKKINHSSSWASVLVPSFISKALTGEDPICQIAVDNIRHVLFGRTQKGCIQVYDMGEAGSDMRFAAHLDSNSITVAASNAARNVDRKHFQNVIHIAAVSKAESSQVHLVAVTDTGVRLYFATTSMTSVDSRPSMLRLSHVRMPPGFTPSGSTGKPTKVHHAFYRQGTSLMIESVSDDMDALWCLSQESFPFQPTMKESQIVSGVEGKTWCVTEIADYNETNRVPSIFFNCLWPEPPSVVNQHVFPQRRFVLLSPKLPFEAGVFKICGKLVVVERPPRFTIAVVTDFINVLSVSSNGSHIVSTFRPVEQLRKLLLASGSGESEAVETFFKFFGATQACAMCLILICQSPEMEKEVASFAVHAFFRYDSQRATLPASGSINPVTQSSGSNAQVQDASFLFSGPAPGGSSHGSYLASPVQQKRLANRQPHTVGPQFSHSTPAVSSTTTTPAATTTGKRFSGKHSGIALYLARILRPIWNHPLVVEAYPDGQNRQLYSRLCVEDLSWFIERLRKLREFMDRYSNIAIIGSQENPYQMRRISSTNKGPTATSDGDQEADARERGCLISISNLIRMSCEALELWRTLADNQMEIITLSLPQTIQEQFLGFSLKDFVLKGHELSAALIGCLMSRYLDDQATVDAINIHLREICPTLFSADDAIYSKASEMIHFAKNLQDKADKIKLLTDGIKMFFKVPELLDLPWICKQLEEAKYHDGIVELCLFVASKRDAKGVSLHFYHAGEPRDDIQGYEATTLRRECYKCILDALDNLFEECTKIHQRFPTEPGPPVSLDLNALTTEQAEILLEQTIKTALKSDDELFHVALYDWMMAKDMTDRLLEVTSPFLERYIVRTAAEQHPNDITILGLLWKHYQKRKNYLSASKVLIGLAEKESDSLTIQERIAYISRAIMCAKNASLTTNASAEGEFLHELEEKLEVARIQFQVHEALARTSVSRNAMQDKADALKILDAKLIDISQLYGDFADRFDLLDCKLQILHCAGYQDQALVENIWEQIIQRALRVDARVESVSQSLIAIGKTYIGSHGFFPIDFLLFNLEKVTCECNWDPTWVFVTFKEIGVPVKQIWNSYDKIFKSKDTTWQTLGKPLHLLNVISFFIRSYLDNTTVVPINDRAAFSRTLCEACSSYLVELESMNEADRLVKNLLSKFRTVRAELKREF